MALGAAISSVARRAGAEVFLPERRGIGRVARGLAGTSGNGYERSSERPGKSYRSRRPLAAPDRHQCGAPVAPIRARRGQRMPAEKDKGPVSPLTVDAAIR